MNEGTFFEGNEDIDFDKLPSIIQKQYKILPGTESQTIVEGFTNKVEYPIIVEGLLAILKLANIHLPTKGENINTILIRKTKLEDPENTYWDRKFTYEDGKVIDLNTRFKLNGNVTLEEFKYGITLPMQLEQIKNGIEFSSGKLLIKFAGLKFPIPEIFTLGKLLVSQTAIDLESYKLTFEFRHPVFKRTYYFEGVYKFKE